MMYSQQKNESGFTLVEAVVYISLFVLISVLLMDSLVVMARVYKETRVNGDLIENSQMVFERMTREIRGATSVDTSVSAFATSSGILKINTVSATGTAKIEQFSLSNGTVQFFENGTLSGDLTNSAVSVSSLVFRNIVTNAGSAVRIELTMSALRSTSQKTITLYDTVALRGAYQQ